MRQLAKTCYIGKWNSTHTGRRSNSYWAYSISFLLLRISPIRPFKSSLKRIFWSEITQHNCICFICIFYVETKLLFIFCILVTLGSQCVVRDLRYDDNYMFFGKPNITGVPHVFTSRQALQFSGNEVILYVHRL